MESDSVAIDNPGGALDAYLRRIASLADSAECYARRLSDLGYRAFMPVYASRQAEDALDREIHRELLKERIGQRGVLVAGEYLRLGYVSPLLDRLCADVGIDRRDATVGQAWNKYLPKISPAAAQEASLSGDERQRRFRAVSQESVALLAAESQDMLDDVRLERLPKSRWGTAILVNSLGAPDFRVTKCKSEWSDSVVAHRVDRVLEVHLIAPRAGSRLVDWLPSDVPQIARPWFGRGIREKMCGVGSTVGYDYRVALNFGALIPGFVYYRSSENWAYAARGLQATAALYLLIENDLVAASRLIADAQIDV